MSGVHIIAVLLGMSGIAALNRWLGYKENTDVNPADVHPADAEYWQRG